MEDPGDGDLSRLGSALADAVEEALPGWVRRVVGERAGPAPGPDPAAVEQAAGEARAAVVPALRALLGRDVDEQGESPLAVVRRAAGPVNRLLAAAGAPVPARDDQQRSLFPDDHYDVVPAAFADLSPEAAEAGIAWGAAKAWVHRRRHSR